ncbi:MAG: UvrD-helicase domain-containing protein, partial [Cyanobium sp.]
MSRRRAGSGNPAAGQGSLPLWPEGAGPDAASAGGGEPVGAARPSLSPASADPAEEGEGAEPAASGFDIHALALDPSLQLLEASAGTGKTFALAHLVLRLVSERGLRLGEILVVTFTEAAAAELRDRIGRRLQEGLASLENATEVRPPDGVLAAWTERCRARGPVERQQLRIRLLLALEELAAADITTIHGFCRRTLVREALTVGRSPQLQLQDPEDPGIEEVVHAYWSRQVLPLPLHLLAGLRRCGLRPRHLEDLLRQLDGDPALGLDPLPPGLGPEQNLAEVLPLLWQQRWQHFQEQWRRDGRALQEALSGEARRWREQGVKDSRPYAPTARKDRCAEVEEWIAGQPEEGDYLAVLEQEQLRDYFHPGPFSKAARRAEQRPDAVVRLPQPSLMQAVAALLDAPAELLLLHGLHHCRSQLRERRSRRGVISFSQLLADLDPGPDGQAVSPLMEAVSARYRAALIDEFQDTDPIQWRILRRAFGGGSHLLVMVGDPKQAIYRFRGGDLSTYLAAAAQAEKRHVLRENRRSSATLILALNRLMEPGLPRSGLAVPAVLPRSSRRGPQGAAIELLWLSPGEHIPTASPTTEASAALPARSELERCQPELTARHLLDLLNRRLTLGEGECQRPLVADDLCVLVSNHRQAELIRSALERHGLASRLVSRADVFASPAATALQRLLDALADPADRGRLRLLAASPLLAWSAARLASASEEAWSELAGELERLARRLGRCGPIGVINALLDSEALARLALGGRLLADL